MTVLHRRRACMALFAVCALLSGGCATKPAASFVQSSWSDVDLDPPPELIVGDVIEVDFFATGLVGETYHVGVDDRLRVDVAEHLALSGDQLLVLPDGTFSAPGIGRLRAAARTVDEIAQEMTEILRRMLIRNPRVTVTVQQADTALRSLVNRRVENSRVDVNLYQISEGGMLQLPFVPTISALRPLEVLRADIADAYAQRFGKRLEVTVRLRQARPRKVYVMGEVVRPGSVDYSTELSGLAAVAAAGGVLPTAERASVVLYRRREKGPSSAWVLDLRDLLTDANPSAQRLAMRPNDVIFVPKSGVALANDAIDMYVRRMLPIPVNVSFGAFVPVK